MYPIASYTRQFYFKNFVESIIFWASDRSLSNFNASSLKVKRKVLLLPSGETMKSIARKGPIFCSLKLYNIEIELELPLTDERGDPVIEKFESDAL
jgi:hypothetical protein